MGKQTNRHVRIQTERQSGRLRERQRKTQIHRHRQGDRQTLSNRHVRTQTERQSNRLRQRHHIKL